jgi:hypothetical protein
VQAGPEAADRLKKREVSCLEGTGDARIVRSIRIHIQIYAANRLRDTDSRGVHAVGDQWCGLDDLYFAAARSPAVPLRRRRLRPRGVSAAALVHHLQCQPSTVEGLGTHRLRSAMRSPPCWERERLGQQAPIARLTSRFCQSLTASLLGGYWRPRTWGFNCFETPDWPDAARPVSRGRRATR